MKHFEGNPYPNGSWGGARLLIGLLLFELCAPVFPTVGQLPVIPDPQLEAAVRCTLFKTDSGPVTRLDLQGLTQLFAPNHEIASLAGLEWATNLLELNISGNSVIELTPLSGLLRLTRLNLERNWITEVGPLAGLTNLSSLRLGGNPIEDLNPLAGLSRLERLSLQDVVISDLAFVQNLGGLIDLNLYDTRLSNVSPLASLTNLSSLDLRWNPITNQNVLATATNLIRLALTGNSISNLNFLGNLTGLTYLSLGENKIRDLSPLVSLSNLSYLVLSYNPITNYAPLFGLTNLINLELRGNAVTNLSFMTNFPHLNYADLAFNKLRDLSPLAGKANLNLVLDGNTNLDYATLSSLTNVSRLWLNGNSITNPAFLGNLTNVLALGLEDNAITNVSLLTRLPRLEHLGLSRNPVFNLEPLSALTNLTNLRLEGNSITNLASLTNLVQLDFLSLNNNRLSDLSFLGALTNLSSLYLSRNRLTNITALASLPHLRKVDARQGLFRLTTGSPAMAAVEDLRCRGVNVNYLPADDLGLHVFLATGPDWYIPAGRTSSLGVYVWDFVVPDDELLFSVSSSDETVIPGTGLALNGSDGARTMRVTPSSVGISTNTLTVSNAPFGLSMSTNIITHILIPDPSFNMPDPGLSNVVRLALGRPDGDLTSVDLLQMTYLNASQGSVTNLSGLTWATNLTSLNLANNAISDLSELRNLPGLTSLNLSSSFIRDLSPLTGLTNLSYLDLSANPITNYSVLSALTNLTGLVLAGNSITNLNLLTNLTRLVFLDLSTNKLDVVWPLVRLTNLNSLSLQQNRLTDVAALTNLQHLANVDVRLNLLQTNSYPVIETLQKFALVQDTPQREPPFIDVRTNWLVAPHTTSSLILNLWDTGPSDEQLGLGIKASSPELVCSVVKGPDGFWTLKVTPTIDPDGTNAVLWVSLTATNDVGLVGNTLILVEVTALSSVDGTLLGAPSLSWTSGGDVPWFGQNVLTRNGHPVAQGGAIGNNQESRIETTLVGPGRLSFWWKVSSEEYYDFFEFSLGTKTIRISGEVDWRREVVSVPAGLQTAVWVFRKDMGASLGLDAAWLDQVTYEPGIWLELSEGPTNQTVVAGTNVSLQVTVTGTVPLSFQWTFDGTNLPGATVAPLVLTNVQPSQAGDYAVVITNVADSVTSAVATLTVWEPPAITLQPTNQTVVAGTNISLQVAATGTSPLSYQWTLNGTNLSGATLAPLVLTNVQSGQAGNYALVVTNVAGSVTSTVASLTVWVPPAITLQPTNQTVIVGTNASFQVAATGTSPLNCQWTFNGNNLPGATLDVLLLTNVQPSQAGNYGVVVTNVAGSVTSTVASLTVWVPPAITLQPTNQTVIAGTNVSFQVAAMGTSPLNYQWTLNGTNLSGATLDVLLLTNVQPSLAGNYAVVVTNVAGSVTSTVASLTVWVPPAITLQPTNQTVIAGTNVSMQVTATGTSPLNYQWTLNGTNLAGATTAPLVLTNVQPSQAGNYAVVVTNVAGSVTSAVASLIVLVPPAITLQPANQTVIAGTNVSMQVTAAGTSPLNYQWTFNGTNLAGRTVAPLVLTNVQPGQAGNYAVVVTNMAGSVTSAVAVLTVRVPPAITLQPTNQIVIAGTNVSLTVAVTGTSPLSYQWTFNGANLAGATWIPLTLAEVQPRQAGNYAVVVRNVAGSVTSAIARLTVLVSPAITLQPTNQTVIAGTNVSFRVAATGTSPLSYQWTFNGTNLPGATGVPFVLTNLQPSQAGNYAVVVTNVAGSVTSAVASLTVLVPPSITGISVTQAGVFLSFPSVAGLNYILQYKNSFSDPTWTPLPPPVPGTGGPLVLHDTNGLQASRFYRVHCE